MLDLKKKVSKILVLKHTHIVSLISLFFILPTNLLLLCGLTPKVIKIRHKLELLTNLSKAFIVCDSSYTQTLIPQDCQNQS